MKRPSPSDDLAAGSTKRLKRCHHSLKKKQAHTAAILDSPQDDFVVQGQLLRAVALQLNAAGFDGATPGALESLRAETEQYVLHLLDTVRSSMNASRRNVPSPQDFAVALASHNLRSSSLLPHLRLRAPASITQPDLALPSPPESPPPSLEPILGSGLSGRDEKKRKAFIPSHLPDLPSRHTWMATSVPTNLETDPRKMRERATEEGVLAEQALRKLMLAKSVGVQNRSKELGRLSKAARRRDEVWEATMKFVLDADEAERKVHEQDDGDVEMDGEDDILPGEGTAEKARRDMDDGVMVNYEKRYWRQAAKNRH